MKLISGLFIIAMMAIITGCSSEDTVIADPPNRGNLVVYNGTLLTMAKENEALDHTQALLIEDGVIKHIGRTADIFSQASSLKNVQFLDLNGKTLLPGFIEPHAHLMLTANGELVTDLTPCLPDKYQRIYEKDYPLAKECKNYIADALGKLAEKNELINGWYVGNGMDPSRMLLDDHVPEAEWLNANRKFLNQPAQYIQSFNSKGNAFNIDQKDKEDGIYPFDEVPLFILDQSGHLAYVNQKAFQAAGICSFDPSQDKQIGSADITCFGDYAKMQASLKAAKNRYGFPDGSWGIACDTEGFCYFSGLLKEESSYQPFVDAIDQPNVAKMLKHAQQDNPSEKTQKRMIELMEIYSKQGVTTFVEGGGSSVGMVNAYKKMVRNNDMAVRLRILYTWDMKDADGNKMLNYEQFKSTAKKIPFDSEEFKGFLSAEGIKLWADGSTQGCSADLIADYASNGLCQEFKKGHQNYDTLDIIENLGPFYGDGWYLNVHANGDQAITNSLAAFKNFGVIGKEHRNTPMTLIHSTVYNDQEETDTIAAILEAQASVPNLSVSHLIGHVAYWGESMKNELGNERGRHIDPALTEWKKGIEVSLHSDMSVTPLYPLWFVEQAVTRNTWKYPYLSGDGKPLDDSIPPEKCTIDGECLTPYRALMAVTAIPAKQHQLDKLGTLERHKIADLVVLEDDPTKGDAQDIHRIDVICTFINGKQVKSSVEGSDNHGGCKLTDLPKQL